MKIIGISTMKDEPDAHLVIEHMRRQGVDEFLVSVERDDATAGILWAHEVKTEYCEAPFNQGAEVTRLAQWADIEGADWILPFDADEYWCTTKPHLTVRDVLLCSPDYDAIFAPMYLHLSPELRAKDPKPLPKVAFRPNADMRVAWGSHNVTGFTHAAGGSLIIRELQYRDFDHFLAKIRKARELHSQPHMSTHEHGSHMWRLCNMTNIELLDEWERHMATETVHDLIPGWPE